MLTNPTAPLITLKLVTATMRKIPARYPHPSHLDRELTLRPAQRLTNIAHRSVRRPHGLHLAPASLLGLDLLSTRSHYDPDPDRDRDPDRDPDRDRDHDPDHDPDRDRDPDPDRDHDPDHDPDPM
jgi:hypothetical protein